jgi:hypothetical protein
VKNKLSPRRVPLDRLDDLDEDAVTGPVGASSPTRGAGIALVRLDALDEDAVMDLPRQPRRSRR